MSNITTFPAKASMIRPSLHADWQQEVVRDLKAGLYYAAVIDEGAVRRIINSDSTCALRMLDDKLVITDTVFAFRRRFADDAFRNAIDVLLLRALEDATISVCEHVARLPAVRLRPLRFDPCMRAVPHAMCITRASSGTALASGHVYKEYIVATLVFGQPRLLGSVSRKHLTENAVLIRHIAGPVGALCLH